MTRRQTSLAEIFETQIHTLALTLRPKTVETYRSGVRSFLSYLRVAFPRLRQLSQLRRDPHLLGWFRWLAGHQPPLSNSTLTTYLVGVHHVLDALAANGQALPDLIRGEDFPPKPHYLPRPLSPQDDQLLQQELRRIDDLYANALLLIRATGMRVGECVHLPLDCLRQVGSEQWALHVPLGKLHTERLVPVDPEVRKIVERILTLRTSSPQFAGSDDFLLPHRDARHRGMLRILRLVLARAAQRAGCVSHVVTHRLRHSFATEMLRLGVSLPALMKLLGHRNIQMTLGYAEVTQQIYSANSTRLVRMQRICIMSPHSRFPKTCRPPTSPASARHWRQLGTSWKCIAANRVWRKLAVNCCASTSAFSKSFPN